MIVGVANDDGARPKVPRTRERGTKKGMSEGKNGVVCQNKEISKANIDSLFFIFS